MAMVATLMRSRARLCNICCNQSRLLNIFSIFNKEAVEKERLRLKDELNRGYFDDLKDYKKNSGKLAIASDSLIPAAIALQFPSLPVQFVNGEKLSLPLVEKRSVKEQESIGNVFATLVCITFRANAQAMVTSWSGPFSDTFREESRVHLYEVSFIDSWLLSLRPLRWALLKAMHSSEVKDKDQLRQVVYAFGDSYDFRKALHITNLLSGYIFLLDQCGRIRWRAWGHATNDELLFMFSCTSKLLQEERS